MIPYWTTKLEMHRRCIMFSPPKHILTKSFLSDICQFSLQSILSNQQTAYEWAVKCHNRTVFIPSSGDHCYTHPWAGIVVVSSGCENCTLTTNHNLLWYLKATTYEILNQYFFYFWSWLIIEVKTVQIIPGQKYKQQRENQAKVTEIVQLTPRLCDTKYTP